MTHTFQTSRRRFTFRSLYSFFFGIGHIIVMRNNSTRDNVIYSRTCLQTYIIVYFWICVLCNFIVLCGVYEMRLFFEIVTLTLIAYA